MRLSADIGGTFTDVVLQDGKRLFSTKILTSYSAPEQAIVAGATMLCEQAGKPPGDIRQVIHGTTLATNTLIERAGAKTALVTTAGFRDVIETRTESRFEQYDLGIQLPTPLVPRRHRFVVRERVAADGDILIDVDPVSLDEVLSAIVAGGFDSVAVAFLHAYANPVHERMVRDAISHRLPHAMVSISSDVSPQMREYERFNTTVVNAYIQPRMKSYLDRLASEMSGAGVSCPIFMMHSGGGIISLEDAARYPVRLVESGPAGGAVFAADLSVQRRWPRVLSFDMGGTTAKICLIADGIPSTSREFEVARSYRFKKGSGMPISIPVIDMVEIGAGGGSLAHVDSMQTICVGPESAASEPGPACYGLGGERPAVSDADLILGKLKPGSFAGGAIELDVSAAGKAIQQHVGARLGMDQTTAAYGICEMVDENMANAARVHAVENGEDLSGYTMIAFGGAAPLHASRLCRKLGIRQWLVPAAAGVGSAVGFLSAPVSFEAMRGNVIDVKVMDPESIGALLRTLRDEARSFVSGCAPGERLETQVTAYMRYKGQGWEIPVGLPETFIDGPDTAILLDAFESGYERLFARRVAGIAQQVTGWAVRASTVLPMPDHAEAVAGMRPATATGKGKLFCSERQTFVDAAHYEAGRLVAGDYVTGSAVVYAKETTIVIDTGFTAVCQHDGSLLISDAGR